MGMAGRGVTAMGRHPQAQQGTPPGFNEKKPDPQHRIGCSRFVGPATSRVLFGANLSNVVGSVIFDPKLQPDITE